MKIIPLFIFLLVMVLVTAGCVVKFPEDKKTVSTSGTTTLSVEPNEATVLVAIETLEKTADKSKNKNSDITEKIYTALYKINVPRDSIQTQYFTIYEEYDWTEKDGRRSIGFKTVHNIRIKTDEFKNLGKVIDATIDAGATRIDSISFDLSDDRKNEVRTQVLGNASKNARDKAQAIASGIGAKLGDIVSVSDTSYEYQPYRYYDKAIGAIDLESVRASTEISPQQLEVSATVQVTWEIE